MRPACPGPWGRAWGGRPAAQPRPPRPARAQEFVWEASHYLVRQVFNSLQEMFSGTRAIQVCPWPTLPRRGYPDPAGAEPVSTPAALAGRERPAHRPHRLRCGVGHAPRHPHHPALPPRLQGVGTCRPHPSPPHPRPAPGPASRSGRSPPKTLQISGGIQSLTFSNSGDASQ